MNSSGQPQSHLSGSPFLQALRRYARGAFVLHGYLIASLILLPISRTSVYADDDPPIEDPALTNPDPAPDQTPPTGDPSYETPPDPAVTDSDGDNLSDAQETSIGSNIYSPDSDNDGLTDADETDITGTSPTSTDTDGDGFSDFNESYGNYSVNTIDDGPGVTPYDHDGDGYEDPVDPDPISPENIPDSDGDYVPDNQDSDPGTPWLWNDTNGNGVNDDAEATPTENNTPDPNTPPAADPDRDGDGIANESDSHPDDPALFNDWNWNGTDDQQEDWDGDGVINIQDSHVNSNALWCDWNQNSVNDDAEAAAVDSDGDSTPDGSDSDPNNASLWSDWNHNGTNDELEGTPPPADSDGDSYPDNGDSDPSNSSLWEDWNHNGTNDSQEPPLDSDGDTHPDSADTDVYNSALWEDYNRNGYNDSAEPLGLDSDGDGTPDNNDSHLHDINLWCDWNGNGVNDTVDNADDDGDGRTNINDSHPQNNQLWNDRNSNGTNDEEEVIVVDADGDGYSDQVDTHPQNGSLWNDHNNDGINDENQTPPDSDNDGVADIDDRFPNDYDNDGIDDLIEVSQGTNPSQRDSDGDGLSDGEEAYAGTNPLHVDTDNDGLTDFEELTAYHTNPLEATVVTATPEQAAAINESNPPDATILGDPTTIYPTPEEGSNSAPTVAANNQLISFAAASLKDTDQDGIPDVIEMLQIYNTVLDYRKPADAQGDADGDNISNLNEYLAGTAIKGGPRGDKDGDGVTDKYELKAGLSITNFEDVFEDPDHDGLLSIEEVTRKWHTRPTPTAPACPLTDPFQYSSSNGSLKSTGGVELSDKAMRQALRLTQAKATTGTSATVTSAEKTRLITYIQYTATPLRYGTSVFTDVGAAWQNEKTTRYSKLTTKEKSVLTAVLDEALQITSSEPAVDFRDIDSDLLPNAWETLCGLDFRVNEDGPYINSYVPKPGTAPAITSPNYPAWKAKDMADKDRDGLSNSMEYSLRTHPKFKEGGGDLDSDGFDNYEEIANGSNPANNLSLPNVVLTLAPESTNLAGPNGTILSKQLKVLVSVSGKVRSGVPITFTCSTPSLLPTSATANTTGTTSLVVTTDATGSAQVKCRALAPLGGGGTITITASYTLGGSVPPVSIPITVKPVVLTLMSSSPLRTQATGKIDDVKVRMTCEGLGVQGQVVVASGEKGAQALQGGSTNSLPCRLLTDAEGYLLFDYVTGTRPGAYSLSFGPEGMTVLTVPLTVDPRPPGPGGPGGPGNPGDPGGDDPPLPPSIALVKFKSVGAAHTKVSVGETVTYEYEWSGSSWIYNGEVARIPAVDTDEGNYYYSTGETGETSSVDHAMSIVKSPYLEPPFPGKTIKVTSKRTTTHEQSDGGEPTYPGTEAGEKVQTTSVMSNTDSWYGGSAQFIFERSPWGDQRNPLTIIVEKKTTVGSATSSTNGTTPEITYETYKLPPNVSKVEGTKLVAYAESEKDGEITLEAKANEALLKVWNGLDATTEVVDKIGVGAFTVANLNDTDGDGTIDKDDNDVPGEKDLMKLTVSGYAGLTGKVKLTIKSGGVKFWEHKEKKNQPIAIDGNGAVFFDIPSGGIDKTIWVEAISASEAVRDIEIWEGYQDADGNVKDGLDKLKATAIWVAHVKQYDSGSGLPPTADHSGFRQLVQQYGDPDLMEFGIADDQTLGNRNMIVHEFKVLPHDVGSEPGVIFDQSRRVDFKSWDHDPITKTWSLSESPILMDTVVLDKPNDDTPKVPPPDEDNTPNHDLIYCMDAPGTSNGAAFKLGVIIRMNCEEYVRVKLDSSVFKEDGSVEGSRCSNKVLWNSRHTLKRGTGENSFWYERNGPDNGPSGGHKPITPDP